MSHQDQLSKGDWITTLKENLDELEIDMDLESIAGLVAWQGRFQIYYKKLVKQRSFDYLQQLRETHSKAKDLRY